ncbi:MAG: TIM barrel protein [Bryobacteraceae bacterium]
MPLSRRHLMWGLSAGAVRAAAQERTANGPRPRVSPALCVHIEQFPGIGYDELGGVIHGLGFDGCVLSVQEGGHITPEHAELDLMRGVEAMTGRSVDVYAIGTPVTSPAERVLQLIFWVGHEMGVPIFLPGQWTLPAEGNLDARLAEIQRDLSVLASFAGRAGMALAVHNGPGGDFGGAVWDAGLLLRGIDARYAGYDFDVGYAARMGAPAAALALCMALPRLKMVTARDCYWTKGSGAWTLTECPLGEGMVDWPAMFHTLAAARYAGPILLRVNYRSDDPLAALRRDLAFLKKQLAL